jgi:hypothetical protein
MVPPVVDYLRPASTVFDHLRPGLGMFIELTDHLRCPTDHPEAYLVLLPDKVVGRNVVTGHLGCPLCGWNTDFTAGAVDFGGGRPASSSTRLTADAIEAFLGLGGPGGYVALAGAATSLIPELTSTMPGVQFVAVNPPSGVGGDLPASVLLGGRLPLKTGSMRGVVLDADLGKEEHWVREAMRVTLPGLRIVGEGPEPAIKGLEILATGGGAWVARKSPQTL